MQRNRTPSKKYKRRQLLVSSSIQWGLVRQSLWHWLLFSATTMFLLGLLQVLSVDTAKPFMEHWQALSRMILTVLLGLVLLLPLFVLDWLKISHRFAGPVEKLRGVLRDVADGKEFTDLRFRDDDYWQQLADELNAAVRSLQRRDSRDTTSATVENEAPVWEDSEIAVPAN